MIKRVAMIGLASALPMFLAAAQAGEKEPSAEIGIGIASEWDAPSRVTIFGLSAAIEYTAIKDWLEIEASVSPLFGKSQTEWNTELVVKKPFSLSDKVEVTFGVGPAWLHKIGGGETTDSAGGVVVLDFQFWPLPERRLGWFLEPSYGYDFGKGHKQSLGVSVGLLFGIP